MSFTRRTFLIGAGSGAVAVLLASCRPEPTPTPRPTPTTTGELPQPSGFVRSAWTTDPFSLGAVSFTAVGALPSDRETLGRPVEDRVFFAGEATSTDRPGTIMGAWRSGSRVANEVIDLAGAEERIAVVGAGVAGAQAASRLAEAGFDVRVLEGRDRVGGRIHSSESEDWPIPVQLGAWRLGTADGDLAARLAAQGVGMVDLTGELYRSAEAEAEVNEVGPSAVETATAWAADRPNDVPLEQALADSGATETAAGQGGDLDGAALLEQYLATLTAVAGGSVPALSSWYPPTAPETVSGVVGDLDEFVADRLDGIPTSLSTSVVGVVYDPDGVSLRLGTGESLSVDRVVITVPLGVLQQDDIEFEPPLPFEHRGAIAALGVGAIETVWLRFEERFWESDAAVWHVVGGDFDIRTWYNLEPATGEPLLVGLVGGDAARRFAELDDEAAAQAAVLSLAAFVR